MKKNKLHKHLQFESNNQLRNIQTSNSQKKLKSKNINSMSQSGSNLADYTVKSLYLESGNLNPNMSIISNIPNLNNYNLNKSLKNTMIIQEYISKVSVTSIYLNI